MPFFEVVELVAGASSLLEVDGEGTERLLDTENFGEEVRDELRDDLSAQKG